MEKDTIPRPSKKQTHEANGKFQESQAPAARLQFSVAHFSFLAFGSWLRFSSFGFPFSLFYFPQPQKTGTLPRAEDEEQEAIDEATAGVHGMKQTAAVIGAGFVGKAHLEALRRLGVPVRGVLGSSRERAVEARESLGLERAYGSLEELAEDSAVTVVHICTPNYL